MEIILFTLLVTLLGIAANGAGADSRPLDVDRRHDW
jgi:hypothetical protein